MTLSADAPFLPLILCACTRAYREHLSKSGYIVGREMPNLLDSSVTSSPYLVSSSFMRDDMFLIRYKFTLSSFRIDRICKHAP